MQTQNVLYYRISTFYIESPDLSKDIFFGKFGDVFLAHIFPAYLYVYIQIAQKKFSRMSSILNSFPDVKRILFKPVQKKNSFCIRK